jgi:CheY-like chemotaxis protein
LVKGIVGDTKMNTPALSSPLAQLADAPHPKEARGRKVLVADDSPITYELLKLLLTQRGHHVDVVTDGMQALKALRRGNYDVALIDSHLPKVDGLRVAATLRRESGDRRLPRLIAVTTDVKGLLSHGEDCANFDRVMSKPLDIYQVGQVVEEEELPAAGVTQPTDEAPAAATGEIRSISPRLRPAAISPFEQLGYNFLSWPGDFDSGRLSARAMQASLGDSAFDGILLRVPLSLTDLVSLWTAKALYPLPLIDLTGTLEDIADVDGSKLNAGDADHLARVIHDFHDRRDHLHKDVLFSGDLGEQMIGRMFVSRRGLTPKYDPNSRSLISYDVALTPAVVAREAEVLCNEGLLKRHFYDRFHVCPTCDSVRLHVREECSHCRSANLREEQYLHHFRCAFQGRETDFRQGDLLICPKCRYELTHFGYDYDRPGSMVVCGDCGKAASEPIVGFVCLDCGSHVDSDAAPTRDVFAYQLTEDGVAFAEHGRSLFGTARQALRFADLPLELVIALNAAAKKYNEEKVPFALVSIFYVNERLVVADHGARAFVNGRALFVENLRGALGQSALVVKGRTHDFALLPGFNVEEARAAFETAKLKAEKPGRHDLGVQCQLFGPEDFS